jgi:hypothetical protein
MWPDLYKRIRAALPGNIPEFEIIPTRQFYWGLPIAEATKQNEGKAKLDKDGYLIPETWIAGYPFPKPSGPFKAQQIMFNVEKRYLSWGLDFYIVARTLGYTKSLKMDFDGGYEVFHTRLAGRVVEPGCIDNVQGSSKPDIHFIFSSRDSIAANQPPTSLISIKEINS